jgi:hypothetical protein
MWQSQSGNAPGRKPLNFGVVDQRHDILHRPKPISSLFDEP